MLVIGNGESRKKLTLKNPNIGCNAAHRDFQLDHLICVDKRCVIEALCSENTKNTIIYTREENLRYFNDSRLRPVPAIPYTGTKRPDLPMHWGSGPYAVLLASLLSNNIQLVGFDLWGKDNLVNNLYKNTVNYEKENSHAVDPRYWIYQISKIFSINSNKYYVIYNNDSWTMPSEWNLTNVEFKLLDNLRQEY